MTNHFSLAAFNTPLFAFSFIGLIKMYLDVNLQVYPTWSSLNVEILIEVK